MTNNTEPSTLPTSAKFLSVSGVFFDSVHDTVPKPFAEQLGFLGESHSTMETKEGARCFSLATYSPGAQRGLQGVTAITALGYDFDGISQRDTQKIIERLNGTAFAIYSTFSHLANGPDDFRLRLIVLLTRPISLAEFRPVRDEVLAEVGVEADKNAADGSRIWFVPTVPASRAQHAFIHYSVGVPLDPEPYLQIARQRRSEPSVAAESSLIVASRPASTRSLGVDGLRQRVHGVRNADTRRLLQPVLDGLPFAEQGERDTTAFEIVNTIAFIAPDSSADAIATLMQPSLDAMQAADPSGALTGAIVHEKAERALARARSAGRRVLQRGDQVELADLLVEDHPSMVFDQGRFHEYQRSTGLWEILSGDSLSREVQRMAGLPVTVGDKIRPLRIESGTVQGVERLAANRLAQPGFFAAAQTGVAFTNGFVRVTDQGLLLEPHDPGQRATWRLPFPFEPYASGPEFTKFMNEVFQGDADAEEKKLLLAEFAGACLTGTATNFSKALVLTGTGGNGKSTFIFILEGLFPDAARGSIAPQSFESEYYRAALDGLRLNSVSELPRADLLRTEAFKAIISGDRITGRQIRQAPREVVPRAGHVFAANTLPAVDDVSPAFWRRLVVVPFNRRWEDAQQDKTLRHRIVANELGAVATWALFGAVRLLQRGAHASYTIPPSHTHEVEKWKLSADQVAQFLADDTYSTEDINLRTPANALYDAYKVFAERDGHRQLSRPKFGARVKALGVRHVKPEGVRFYCVGLKNRLVPAFQRPDRMLDPGPNAAAPNEQNGARQTEPPGEFIRPPGIRS